MLFFFSIFFFFNVTATTEIYTLSLHDALPIFLYGFPARAQSDRCRQVVRSEKGRNLGRGGDRQNARLRSEEHTSELQSHSDLVCRLLLEKKKKKKENLVSI